MPIYDSGTLNTSAIVVPDVYVGIVPPQPYSAGVPSDTVGGVGTASWGPVNVALEFGDMPGEFAAFGPIQPLKYDLGTQLYMAALQGASDFRGVRVTDGTDTRASVGIPAPTLAADAVAWASVAAAVNSGIGVIGNASQLVTFDAVAGVFHALWTGSYGDTISVATAPGARAGSLRLVVSASGRQPEVFDNLACAAGAVPGLASYALAGGTDGYAGVNAAALVGNIATGTGIYALASQNCAAVFLADCDDVTQLSVQGAFARQEALCVVTCGPAGDTVPSASVARLAAEGIDDWRTWYLAGDWIWINDQANGLVRLVSPVGVGAGRLAAQSPEQSPLNKPLVGVIGSQKVGAPGASQLARYSAADLQVLVRGGVDVLTNPAPGGAYWAFRMGHNTSSDQTRQSLSYTTMTNFVAKSLEAICGKYVGKTISSKVVRQANAETNAFFALLSANDQIGSLDGSQPWRVVCDATNNPTASTGIGFLRMSTQCRYLGIIEKFLVDLEGGASVTIGA